MISGRKGEHLMKWLSVFRGNEGTSLLPALGGALLFASVCLGFVSNNNLIYLKHQFRRSTQNLEQELPRTLALADTVAALPNDFYGQDGAFPRIPNSIARRAFHHAERSQLLRVYLRLGGKNPSPLSWCPQPGQSCNDLVAVTVAGSEILLDPARGGALKAEGVFLTRATLKGSWTPWPSRIPSAVVWAKERGIIKSWPAEVDRMDRLLMKALAVGFVLILVLMRLRRRKKKNPNKTKRGQRADGSSGSTFELGESQAGERSSDEDELHRAVEEHDTFLREAAVEQAVSDVVATAAKGVKPEPQAGENQLSDLDKGQSEKS